MRLSLSVWSQIECYCCQLKIIDVELSPMKTNRYQSGNYPHCKMICWKNTNQQTMANVNGCQCRCCFGPASVWKWTGLRRGKSSWLAQIEIIIGYCLKNGTRIMNLIVTKKTNLHIGYSNHFDSASKSSMGMLYGFDNFT